MRVIPITYCDPICYLDFLHHEDGIVFLDSSCASQGHLIHETNRYSFIGIRPSEIFILDHEDPFPTLKKILSYKTLKHTQHLPPFQGGICGFLSYDNYQFLENIPKTFDDQGFPNACIGVYDTVLTFDHLFKKAYIVSTSDKTNVNELLQFSVIVKDFSAKTHINSPLALHASHTQQEYMRLIQTVIDYIIAGDIYQANLTRRWSTNIPKNYCVFQLYKNLRMINPAPFSCYMRFGKYRILSSSPERFLKKEDANIETRPIKGTCKRLLNQEDDNKAKGDLYLCPKNRSENLMIVDLMRSDLARVSKPHTVHVPKLFSVESYAMLHHLVSVVTAQLQDNMDALDVIKATFPAGSITGAPKIRAMEIIRELEQKARGPYCGSAGYITWGGYMDMNVLIRTICINDNYLSFQTGGGIVYDSDPLDEYQETELKAKALHQSMVI